MATSSALPAGYTIRFASTDDDFAAFARLACAYHAWLNVDLRFQNFEQELASLPGSYGAPAGCILVVSSTSAEAHSASNACQRQDVGCVALRPLKQCHSQGACSSLADQQRKQQNDQADQTTETALQDTYEHALDHSNGEQRTIKFKQQAVCELKRLWVDEQHQQKGLGRALITAAMTAATNVGYTKMVLDTLTRLEKANELYEKLGFVRREPYYHNPLPGKLHQDLAANKDVWVYNSS